MFGSVPAIPRTAPTASARWVKGSLVQGDPVVPRRAVLGGPNVFEDAAVLFDRASRGDIVRGADDEDTIQAQGAGGAEHLAQRPAGQTAAARGWAYAVTD